jgi:hypothetical protein
MMQKFNFSEASLPRLFLTLSGKFQIIYLMMIQITVVGMLSVFGVASSTTDACENDPIFLHEFKNGMADDHFCKNKIEEEYDTNYGYGVTHDG